MTKIDKKQLLLKVAPRRTICEVHREIWDVLDENLENGKVKELCFAKIEEAYVMAKKMNQKLIQYKHDFDENWWEAQQPDILVSKQELRQKRKKK